MGMIQPIPSIDKVSMTLTPQAGLFEWIQSEYQFKPVRVGPPRMNLWLINIGLPNVRKLIEGLESLGYQTAIPRHVTVSGVEFALDYPALSEYDARAIAYWLQERVWKPQNRDRPTVCGATSYASARRWGQINWSCYPRESKVTNGPCAHLDARLTQASHVQERAGVFTLHDLIDFDFRELSADYCCADSTTSSPHEISRRGRAYELRK